MAVNETIVDPKTKKTYKADENGVCKEINNGMITTKLSDAERFIEIFDIATGNIYYGGDQSWYYWSGLDGKTKVAREGGCGTVAAANIVAYLAAHNSEYEKLYEYPDYTKENFLLHMNKMYEYVTPRSVADQPLGIWPVSRLKNGIVEFAQERGIKLIAKVIDAFTTKKGLIKFIKTGLESDSPIAMVMGTRGQGSVTVTYPVGGTASDPFRFHWVIITKLSVDENDENAKVKVSSWGGYAEIDLFDNIQGELLYFAFIYFN